MDSTPDHPVPSPEEPEGRAEHADGSAPAGEPVVPPADPAPPPADPAAGQTPANPYASGPTTPGQPGYGQPGAWQQPAPAKKGLSFGAGLGIGVAIGVVAHVAGIGLVITLLQLLNGAGGLVALLWPFVLIAVAAAVMMFFPKLRSFATGILITAAATWLVVIGPCIVLITSLGG